MTQGASDDGRGARWATPDPAETPARREPVLVLGTTNAGKVRELLALVAPHGLTCRALSEMAGAVEVEFDDDVGLFGLPLDPRASGGRRPPPRGRRRSRGTS